MEDRWYSLRCTIALAKEFSIAPDDLEVAPVLEMVEGAQFYGNTENKHANLMPDNEEQERAIMNDHYPVILEKIFQNQHPFVGFLKNIMDERGII
jgi:hypothetical protein